MKNFEAYLKARLREAPISQFLGQRLDSCKEGCATVRLAYRPEFQQSYGVVRNGKNLIVCEMIVYGSRRRKIALATGTYARLEQKWT